MHENDDDSITITKKNNNITTVTVVTDWRDLRVHLDLPDNGRCRSSRRRRCDDDP